ncbi:MAG: CBS domain-containing protein [Methanobacteriota archaeon]|nr:MAG: CBS domain-containing protein [Euryarchaeota archaeon]
MASRSPRAASSSKPASRSRGSRSRSSRQVSCDWVRRFREPIAALFLYASPLSLSPRSGFFMKRNKVQDLRVSDFMSTDLVTASPDETLGDVLGKMKSNDIHELPVIERKKLVGVVTMRELMRRRNLPPTTKVSTVLEIPPGIGPETPLPEAAEQMISAGFRAIPVVKGKALVGIISRSDIVRALVETRALEGVVVRDFMTPNPQAVAEDDTVEHAVQIIRSLGERSVPVVDKHRHLKGVVGLKDVVDLFARPKVREQYGDRAGREEKVVIEVKSVMRYPPLTVGPDADVQRAAELMAKQHVSSVIVTERDEPVGIITSQDLMQFLAGLREREQLFVEIGGLEDEPKDTYDEIYAVIQKEMRRIAPLVQPRTLTIHFQKYKPEGDRWKYSLRARFTTAHRIYYAHEFDWDLRVALTKLLDTLYKRIVKEKERKVTERKRHHQST